METRISKKKGYICFIALFMRNIYLTKQRSDFCLIKWKMEISNNQNRWCVYVLRCRKNYLYIGMTNNLEKRMTAHEKGIGSKFVTSHKPFELIKVIYCTDSRAAKKLEYSLKGLKRRDKFMVLKLKYCEVSK